MRRSRKQRPHAIIPSVPSPASSPPPQTPSYPSFPHDDNNTNSAPNSTHNLPFGSVRLPQAAVDQRGVGSSALGDSVAAAPPKMSGDHKRHWRRGSSIRSKSQPSLQEKVKTKPEGSDGFVPYRPPYISPSTISLSAPVRPSGAQGIGLAPTPAAVPDKPPKKTIFGWFGRRRAKQQQQKLASVSTPALLDEPKRQGNTSIRTDSAYPHYGHRPHAQSADLLSPSSTAAGGAGHLGVESGVTESPSVLTGLVAPKMLFSPLSRSIRDTQTDLTYPYGTTPYIEHQQMPQGRSYPRVGDNAAATSSATFLGQRPGAKWPDESTLTLNSEGSKSRLTVNTVCDALTFPRPRMHAHEVTPPDSPEFDDAVTGGPDDGGSNFHRVYAAGEAREAEREEWADITRKRRSASLKSSRSQRSQRSQIGRRRSDEWSIRRNSGTPVHPFTGEPSDHKRSKSTASSIRSLFRSGTNRLGRTTRSYDNLPAQTMPTRLQTPTKPHSSRPSTAPSQQQQSSWPQPDSTSSQHQQHQQPWGAPTSQPQPLSSSSRPNTAPSRHHTFGSSSSRPSAETAHGFSSRPTTAPSEHARSPKRSDSKPLALSTRSLSFKQRLPKSTSSPHLASLDDTRVSCAPQRSKSTRSHTFTRSDPDLIKDHYQNYPRSTTGASEPGGRRGFERSGSLRENERGRNGSPPPKLRRRQTGPPRTFQFRLQPPTHRHAPSGSNLVMVGGAGAPDNSRLDSTRLHTKHAPRVADFADSARLPTPPPHLPTPERSSPFNYNFTDADIGVAITTDMSVAPVQHRLPMDTPPSARPQTREDPSSAHARYVLARQHRRHQTLRAFQSPPDSPRKGRKSPDIYPQAAYVPPAEPDQRFSQLSMYSQNTTLSSAHSGPMSPTRLTRPGYPTPHRQAGPAQDVASPPIPSSPRSPKTAWFGRPRDAGGYSPPLSPTGSTRSVLSPRAKPASPVRPRTPPSSWHRRHASSGDGDVPPLPPMPPAAKLQTPMMLNKNLPTHPATAAPAVPPVPALPAAVPPAMRAMPTSAPAKIPPQRRPPSRPPPPTPTPPVSSRANSTDDLSSAAVSRSQSLRSFKSFTDTPSGTGPLTPRAFTPPIMETPADDATTPRQSMIPPPSAAGSKGQVATPPPASTLPTIMDESPTPIRQTRVSVLAGMPAPETPLGGQQGAASTRRNLTSPTSSDYPGWLERSRHLPGSPLAMGLASSTAAGSPAATLFAGPAQARPDEATQASDRSMSPSASAHGHGSETTGRPIIPKRGASLSSSQSFTDAQSFVSARTHASSASTSTLGGDANAKVDQTTIASNPSSFSLYTATEGSWGTGTPAPASRELTSNDGGSDTDSESGLSEATLPELLPMSSTSGLSEYSDARDDEQENGQVVSGGPESADAEKSAVTPPVTSAPFAPLTRVSPPSTPPRQIRMMADDDHRKTIMPDTDAVESLMITPRPGRFSRSPRTPGTNNTEPFEFDNERRSPSGSISSGSEGSVRNSMDESFRGLFFRTPQVASPSANRPLTAPATAPTMINPPARTASRQVPMAFEQPAYDAPPRSIDQELMSKQAEDDDPTPMPGQEQFAYIPFPQPSVRQPLPLTSVHDRRAPPRGNSLGPPIGLEQASPFRDTDAAKRALSIQTSDLDNQRIPFPNAPFDQAPLPSSSKAPASPSHASPHGLGVVMSPYNDEESLPGWDNSTRIGPTSVPHDDSWISACE